MKALLVYAAPLPIIISLFHATKVVILGRVETERSDPLHSGPLSPSAEDAASPRRGLARRVGSLLSGVAVILHLNMTRQAIRRFISSD